MNNFRFIKISKDYQCNKLTKFPHILLYLYLVIAYILTSSLSSYSVNQLFNQAAETARERPPYQLYYSHTHVPNRLYESNICCVSRLLLFVYININFWAQASALGQLYVCNMKCPKIYKVLPPNSWCEQKKMWHHQTKEANINVLEKEIRYLTYL